MTVNFTKGKFNLREKLKELERPSVDKLVTKDENGAYIDTIRGTTKLESIDSVISDTAVDIFIYDTSKDSDGGAWRYKTQRTSWYNEELNTATRGSRREFPAVAVIVATSSRVTIYDGDDPDLPMWMVFNRSSSSVSTSWTFLGGTPNSFLTCISMFNGLLVVGSNQTNSSGFAATILLNFLSETISIRYFGGSFSTSNSAFVNRNLIQSFVVNSSGEIINGLTNDVAMTVLPNAPIDSATGLPIPTIAVGTDGGVSVIKDDGTVVDITSTGAPTYDNANNIEFTKDNKIVYTEYSGDYYGWLYVHDIPASDTSISLNTQSSALSYYDTRNPLGNFGQEGWIQGDPTTVNLGDRIDSLAIGDGLHLYVAPRGNSGFTFIEDNRTADKSSLYGYATTSYNTGWMHGNIKGAFLSDTDATNITGSNLIDNGDFGTGDFTNWSINGTTTPTISSGGALITTGAIDGAIWQSTSGEATSGKWVITWTITSNSGGFFGLFLNNNAPNGSGGSLVQDSITTSGSYYYEGNITAVEFRHRGSSSGIIDNISLRRVESDRSVNNKGLQVFGTINKSAVATGAELVAYSGFGASNGLIQPYNSALDFGTGDYYMSIWAYGGSTDQALMIREEASGDANGAILIFQYNGYYAFYSRPTGTPTWTSFLSTAPYGNYWSQIYLVRRSGVLQGYVNGNLVGSTAFSGTVTNTIAQVSIGKRVPGVNTQYFTGSLALAKIGSGAPSPTQIAKIYNDEKALFQPNSQCTLYGSSDAVTALAYDDSTNLLYAGTSSGRSDFQGLRRINNTTTAVTTAISASNGLVAEQ